MRWNATTRALTMTVLLGLGASALADDTLPSLDGPAGPVSSPAPAPTPVPSPAQTVPSVPPPPPASRSDRGVLALPGITAPSSRATNPAPRLDSLPPPSLAPSADGGLPMLEGPAGRRPAGAVGSPSPGLLALPSERFGTRVVESTPVETTLPALPPSRSLTAPLPAPAGRGAPASLGGSLGLRPMGDLPPLDGVDDLGPKRPKAGDLDGKDDRTPAMSPARRPGPLGGRLLPRMGTALGIGAGMNRSESAIKAEPRTDPAADAAIKRRVERQAREAVGDRARSLDVRVVGRDITIRASGTRILQRRAVRRSLETLPGLSGYRSTVVVDD